MYSSGIYFLQPIWTVGRSARVVLPASVLMDAASSCCLSDLRWPLIPRIDSNDCCCAAIAGYRRIAKYRCFSSGSDVNSEPGVSTTRANAKHVVAPPLPRSWVSIGVIQLGHHTQLITLCLGLRTASTFTGLSHRNIHKI